MMINISLEEENGSDEGTEAKTKENPRVTSVSAQHGARQRATGPNTL